jgi:enterochelin esterase-like enzyme
MSRQVSPPLPHAGQDTDLLTFRLPDRARDLRAVRLRQDVGIPADHLSFEWSQGAWELLVDRPPVDRMEYLLELTGRDGSTQTVPDPGNPLRAPGAFGEKSVLELPGYRRPLWLDAPAPAGHRRTVTIPTRSLGEDLDVRLWSPAGLPAVRPAPLLVVHDGPEYDALAGLTTYLSAWTAAGTLPPVRAALLPPGPRNDRYSGDGAYTRALCLAVLPRLRSELATTRTVGMGASLGALAMLHAQRQHAGCLDALFLQSGSFFHPRHDAHERRFEQYDRVVRSVAAVLRSGGHPAPVPTVMTCGTIEENLANNRIMARALAAQGYDVTLREVRDAHNYTAWRDALDPWLTGLLRELAR